MKMQKQESWRLTYGSKQNATVLYMITVLHVSGHCRPYVVYFKETFVHGSQVSLYGKTIVPKHVEPNKRSQVRQQAWKTQIPPYGLTLRHRPQFRMFTKPRQRTHAGSRGSRGVGPVRVRTSRNNAAAVTPR